MAVWYGFQSASEKKLICKDAATDQQLKGGMCRNRCPVVSFLKTDFNSNSGLWLAGLF